MPVNSGEAALVAEALADAGDQRAEPLVKQLSTTEADAILAKLRYRQSRLNESAALLRQAFLACRRDAWPSQDLIGRSLDLASNLAHMRAYAGPLYDALEQPFAAGQWNDIRKYYRMTIAHDLEDCGPRTVRALKALEPWPFWNESALKIRRDCYASTMAPLAGRAKRDYDDYYAAEPLPFAFGITPAPSGSSSDHR